MTKFKPHLLAFLSAAIAIACPEAKYHYDNVVEVNLDCSFEYDCGSLEGTKVTLVHALDSTGRTTRIDCGELDQSAVLSGSVVLGWGEEEGDSAKPTTNAWLVNLVLTKPDGGTDSFLVDLRDSTDDHGQVQLKRRFHVDCVEKGIGDADESICQRLSSNDYEIDWENLAEHKNTRSFEETDDFKIQDPDLNGFLGVLDEESVESVFRKALPQVPRRKDVVEFLCSLHIWFTSNYGDNQNGIGALYIQGTGSEMTETQVKFTFSSEGIMDNIEVINFPIGSW